MSQAPWVIVAGGVDRLGGTDRANFALIDYLLELGTTVHLITHKVDAALAGHPKLHLSRVPVPIRSCFAGERLLSLEGRRVARSVTARFPHARVVVNGGNCIWSDINWVHCVHHAWTPVSVKAPWIHRLKHRLATRAARRRELRNLSAARIVIANSELTRRHIIELVNVDARIVHTVHLGAESEWPPASESERRSARERLSYPPDRPLVAFIGAIGYDNNKGFDTLLHAWRELCARPAWDADLMVAGDGRALGQWRAWVAQSAIRDRVRFLGFTSRVPELLAAADVLVSPVRYESYGLNVQEALCRGVPAIVSAGAGVAEIYPSYLKDLLLPDPEDTGDLADRLFRWRSKLPHWREQTVRFSQELRRYSWRDMAERFYCLVTGTGQHSPVPIASVLG